MADRNAEIARRASVIARFASPRGAVESGASAQFQDLTLSEAVVIGLLAQGVRAYVGVLGHGCTDIADVLAYYEAAGAVRMYNARSETEASHAATMLRWQYGESAAVIASIGPGALQALGASIAASSNGIGVYHLYGDETTHGEGPNMQQIPSGRQGSFLRLAEGMGGAWCLHTPESVFAALRKGAATVFHPYAAGPFFLLAPMNVQPATIRGCNLLEFPERPRFPATGTADEGTFLAATDAVRGARAITIKYGGGAGGCGPVIRELAELVDAVIVSGAKTAGVVPAGERRYMSVGGTKGSICGNFAMNNADLGIVIGARSVCQWDSSGTAWQKAGSIINFNADVGDASHYNRSIAVLGDAKANLARWIAHLKESGFHTRRETSAWLAANLEKRREWEANKAERFATPVLRDDAWGREVLTQPAAIKTVWDFARARGAAMYFDSGDVQAQGFQIVEDDREGVTFSETGSSYMGFAVSSLLAGAMAGHPVYAFALSGDGSFTMNPQILFDGVAHGARGCIVLLDNRRMAAISGLQVAQYGRDYRTSDRVETDYVALARAVRGVKALSGGFDLGALARSLEEAYAHPGISLVHVPVYFGYDPRGSLGSFGTWNVGNWCDDVQRTHHRIGL